MSSMIDIKAIAREMAKGNLIRRIAHYLDLDPERRRTIEAALAPDDLESLKDASYERVREAEWKARCLAHEKSVCVGCWNHKSEIGAQAGGTAQ